MQPGPPPDSIDTRLLLRAYAWATTIIGVLVYGWAEALLPHAGFPAATPANPWALTRVGAALVLASGCCAAGLARVEDPVGRRRALTAFALGHLLFGGLFFLPWWAIFAVMLPPLVGWGPLLLGAVLLYVALIGRAHGRSRRVMMLGGDGAAAGDKSRVSTIVDVKADAMHALRSHYEAQIQQAARQEERARLARDLHDAVKQQLFVIQTAAATVEQRFDADRAGARSALGQVRAAAREASTEMEAMIEQLQTTPMEVSGLVEALKRQCEALELRTGAAVTFTLGALPPNNAMPPGTPLSLFRGAQEALANIGRHARATRVTVALGTNNRRLALTIGDDGIGFDPLAGRRGMGLENMTTRVAALGGSFELRSAPGRGTQVEFSVPCGNFSLRHFAVRALIWSVPLALAAGYALVRGVEERPWLLALIVMTGLTLGRQLLAISRLRRLAGAAA